MLMNGIILYYQVNASMTSSILSPQHSMPLLTFPSVYIQSSFSLQSCSVCHFAWDKNN